jgi:eukaryotic-like serine/threonine-protein kinase
MTPEEWQRVRPILESALELTPAKRASFLDAACTDSFLRREVESLILSHEQAGEDCLNSVAIPELLLEEVRFSLPRGKRIGSYEVLEEIAQGGMGAVYRAIRADGQYKQQVALKTVRADIGVGLSANRFRNERQILAALNHPNIARILDGGTTTDGLPYLVMEFIDGLTIIDYCDQKKVTIEGRLQLFRTICSAVHYAHQHLVIHRDIKPGNILITSEGIPKLLDFGIAKILDPSLLQASVTLTSPGLSAMTTEYASPEQLRGETITTATDVYSLGLVLYELLAGHCAHRFASRMPHDIARIILETDPQKPSTVIRRRETARETQQEKAWLTPEEVSGLRDSTPEKLRRTLAGDLDNIVLKAIRKEPDERYSSVDQLSEDLRRYLEKRPVLARKSTFIYRCRKYVARHKIGMASAALIFLSLVTGLAFSISEARIAHANQLRAERRFNDVRTLANSLMFEIYDSIKDLPGATNARKILASNARQYLDSLSREASGDLSLQHDLAAAYDRLGDVFGYVGAANLGDFAAASQSYAKALAIRESLASANPGNLQFQLELTDEYFRLEGVQESRGDFSEALSTVRRAQAFLERIGSGSSDPRLQDRVGGLYYYAGALLEKTGDQYGALQNYRKAASFHKIIAADPRANALSRAHVVADYTGMANTLSETAQANDAVAMATKALTIMKELSEAAPTNATLEEWLAETYFTLGTLLDKMNNLSDALENDRDANRIFRQLMAGDPNNQLAAENVVFTTASIAGILVRQGKTAEALSDFHKALSIVDARGGSKNLWDATALSASYSGLGKAYVALAERARSSHERIGHWREARSWYQKGLDVWNEKPNHGRHDADGYDQAAYFAQQIKKCDTEIRKLTLQRTSKASG